MSVEVNISLLRSLVDLLLPRFYKHLAPTERGILFIDCQAINISLRWSEDRISAHLAAKPRLCQRNSNPRLL